MIYNRIPIIFGGLDRVTGPTISYQYDKRQILVFTDLDLPQYYEVDICNEGDTTTTTMVGSADGVLVPNAYLRNGRRVKVYIVVQGQDQGAVETRKELTLPVQVRPAREDIDPTDPEQQQIDELIEILNEAVIMAMPAGGDEGQVLAKKSGSDYDAEWIDQSGGGGGTTNYNSLENKPQINNVELRGNKSADDLGLGTYSKPADGIPKTDLASDVQTSLGKADSALQTAPVASVAGKTGAVTLDGGDVGFSAQGSYSSGTVGAEISSLKTEISEKQDAPSTSGTAGQVLGLDNSLHPVWVNQSGGGGAVDSVNGKTGVVVLDAEDVGAYEKPSTGIPATDLASAVQTSLEKADDAIPAPSSPATGAFLVWNGSAWVAQTLSTWQGGNY